MPQGWQKEQTTQVDVIKQRTKEQQRVGTKEDQSLQGTIKLVRVIPVIKKNQSKQSQDNVQYLRVATRQKRCTTTSLLGVLING